MRNFPSEVWNLRRPFTEHGKTKIHLCRHFFLVAASVWICTCMQTTCEFIIKINKTFLQSLTVRTPELYRRSWAEVLAEDPGGPPGQVESSQREETRNREGWWSERAALEGNLSVISLIFFFLHLALSLYLKQRKSSWPEPRRPTNTSVLTTKSRQTLFPPFFMIALKLLITFTFYHIFM